MHDGEAWAVGAQLCGREEEAHMVGPGVGQTLRLDPGLAPSQAVDMAVCCCYLRQLSGERGLIIYLPQEGRGIGLANKIAAYALQDRVRQSVSHSVSHEGGGGGRKGSSWHC